MIEFCIFWIFEVSSDTQGDNIGLSLVVMEEVVGLLLLKSSAYYDLFYKREVQICPDKI